MSQSTNHKPPTFDQMLDALQSRRRRKLLVDLTAKNSRHVVKQVRELDAGGDEEKFLTNLRHVDLPKLEGLGFIEWDRRTDEIVSGPQFDQIQPLIRMMMRHRDQLPNDWL